MTQATDQAGNLTTLHYDAADNLTEIDYPGGLFLKFQYNVVGQRTQSVDQTGFTVNYTYDALGRLSKLTDGGNNLIVRYTYDAAGLLIEKDLGNDTYATYQYDKAGDLLHLVNHAPRPSPGVNGPVNSEFDYTYDALGRATTETTSDGQWVYSYDTAGQLTHAVFTPGGSSTLPPQDLQYTYDAAGNRTQTIINGVTTAYTVNNVNEYTQVGGTSYTYDADGNLATSTTAGVTTTYAFNQVNQLTGITSPTDTWSYQYDPFGNQVSSTDNGVTTQNLIDPAGLGNIAAQFDGSGNLIAHYTYGLGLVSQVPAVGSAGYYDFDLTGNTAGITGAAGTYVNKYAYLPFGTVAASSGSLANPFTFVGQAGVTSDGSGLIDMRARYYDATSGQFLSSDPSGLLGGNTNLRQYVDNMPLSYIDPSGLQPSGTHWPWDALPNKEVDSPVVVVPPPPPYTGGGYDKGGDKGGDKGRDNGDSGNGGGSNGGGSNAGGSNAGGKTNPNVPSGQCFLPETLVATECGLRAIAEIKPGDRVWAYHFANGTWQLSEVECRHDSEYDGDMVTLSVGTEEVTATSNHPFWVVEGQELDQRPAPRHVGEGEDRGTSLPGRWIDAHDLREGDAVFLRGNGPVAICRVRLNPTHTPVCNLTVGGLHNFAVGGIQILVHNKIGGGAGAAAAGMLGALGGIFGGTPPSNGPPKNSPATPAEPGPSNHSDSPGSFDPNELIGPAGFGTPGFLTSQQVFPYAVGFENDPKKATLAAQDVTVTVPLSPNLDWSTFVLGDIQFGATTITVPPGLQSFSATVNTTNIDGTPLLVSINASLNAQTGVVTWSFVSLDPATGQPPTSLVAGFLPVDDSTGRGQGFVHYTILPKVGLATGASVQAQAAVVFDTNASLNTNTTTNTIDAGAPTSSVTALSAKSPPSFTLTWSGQDDAGGSGIGSYTIYESEDNGPFVSLANTSATSMTITGQVGHTYSFYSVAIDNVGNLQPAPTSAQASTTIANEESLSDFLGLGHSEPTVYRPSTAAWYVQGANNTTQTLTTFGWLGHDIPVPGDYDGVGHTEQAVYRPSTSQWFVLEPNGTTKTLPTFGWQGHDVPVPGDYDGVGHTQQAVYRPSTGQWFVLEPNGTTETLTTFGWTGHDVPVPGDYDGAGHTEPAVYRPSTAQWFVLEPNGTTKALSAFGWANFHDIPAPGDYDGVGHVQQAVYRPSTGQWFVLEPNGTTKTLTTFGWSGHDLPVTAPIDSLLQLGVVGGIKASSLDPSGPPISAPSPQPASVPAPAPTQPSESPRVVTLKKVFPAGPLASRPRPHGRGQAIHRFDTLD